jgi:mannose-1-phosphate guanylyltransferase/phosphomannomutase
MDGFLAHIDEERIQRRRFRIVLDYAHGTAFKIFPSILGQLQCDVIAINAHPDDRKITKTREEFEKSLAELSQIVQTLQADFGVMLDAGAEKIFLCDDQGKIMSGTETLLVMLRLHGIHQSSARVAVPVHATTAAEPIVEMSGGIVSRTKVRTRSFIETGIAEKCTMLGEPTGGFVFPDFLEAFDAMFAIAKLMEYLASSDKPLSSFHQDLPKNYVLERRLQCEDEDKPRLLRKLSEQGSEAQIQLLDGVRWVWPNRWALFLPDPDKPELQIFSEAESQEETIHLADRMSNVAQGYLR